jgi:hypothetical protein
MAACTEAANRAMRRTGRREMFGGFLAAFPDDAVEGW